jgi:transcriptional regulator with GAF, ATPase, and Fis domain
VESLQQHGFVRNFNTILRNFYEEQEDVEVAGAALITDGSTRYGLIIRVVRPAASTTVNANTMHRHSVEQLTDLVGRVKLKELVRESADLIENLAIQAALELTNDNRASAAELLGLSRQSLYSKMRRFGLGNLPEGEA